MQVKMLPFQVYVLAKISYRYAFPLLLKEMNVHWAEMFTCHQFVAIHEYSLVTEWLTSNDSMKGFELVYSF